MNERQHLIDELEKLEITKKYIQNSEEDTFEIYET